MYRFVSSRTSASPGPWKTRAQPCGIGLHLAVTERDTHTVTAMAATQVIKTEWLINAAAYFAVQDPSSVLFVQPTQGAATSFSKERFDPTVEVTPLLREALWPFRDRNTLDHKEFAGGAIDFVGANSPMDLASRPKRVIICDEIDKYPPSAGAEGDPLTLAEERASTFRALGRAKFLRACSPTDEDTSRVGREYRASDQRRCFVPCPHCGDRFEPAWKHVLWEKDEFGEARPETAGIACPSCGAVWTEGDRYRALDALIDLPDHGWRQTRLFACCGERQAPERWTVAGRSLCRLCDKPAPYGGHAGFVISKLLSRRHRLSDVVAEFCIAKDSPELLKKFFNTAMADLWRRDGRDRLDSETLMARAELIGPDDLPVWVEVITVGVDTQGDRLEVQFIGWGPAEECVAFRYEVIHQDPAQPAAWRELDSLLMSVFTRRDGVRLRVAAACIDSGGHHAAQVYAFARMRRRRRIFAIKGRAGAWPIWPNQAHRSRAGKMFWPVGVDTAKDAIYGKLKIEPESGETRRPALIHFAAGDGFGPDYYTQLISEHREVRMSRGQRYSVWVLPAGKRNEALDTFVYAYAARKSLPYRIDATLEFGLSPVGEPDEAPAASVPQAPATAPIIAALPRPDTPAAPRPVRPHRQRGGWLQPRR